MDLDEAKSAIKYAVSRGVNFIDTAPFYTDRRSVLLPYYIQCTSCIARFCNYNFLLVLKSLLLDILGIEVNVIEIRVLRLWFHVENLQYHKSWTIVHKNQKTIAPLYVKKELEAFRLSPLGKIDLFALFSITTKCISSYSLKTGASKILKTHTLTNWEV